MEFVNCNNFRTRGDGIQNFNIEEIIKSIENQCDVDMNSPKWRNVITRIQAAVIDYGHRVKDHKLRNSLILDKLQKEFTYRSPFDLTDVMARTASKWEYLKTLRVAKVNPLLPESIQNISSRSITTEIEEEEIPEIKIDDDDIKEKVGTFPTPLNSSVSSKTINNNMSSTESEICKEIINDILAMIEEKQKTEYVFSPIRKRLFIKSLLKRSPKIIKICSSQQYNLTLKLKNCANHTALIQYQPLIEMSTFKHISVLPAIPVKLFPGIAYTFKLTFELVNPQDFVSNIKFHVQYPANSMTLLNPYEYYVPIVSLLDQKLKYRSVTVPEMIVIPPIYSWQVNNKSELYEYPFGSSDVSVDTDDTHSYYVRIVKREVDIASDDAGDENGSNEFNITSPTSAVHNIDDEIKDYSLPKMLELPSDVHNEPIRSSSVPLKRGKSTTPKKSVSNIPTTSNPDIPNEVLQLIVNVVERAMDVFVFDKTYLFLKSGETKLVRVYFIHVHHIGCHNCYYDFNFYDSESNKLIFTKTTRVFADIMPHPIQITPDTLDMTNTPITFGKCVNSFVITNTHYAYPVNIRIVTSAKMKKLLKIQPMKSVILQKKSAKFVVSLCPNNEDEFVIEDSLFVLFTVKIVISGYASAYKNITPIYYDIIAPGIHEYENVYHKKYSETTPNQCIGKLESEHSFVILK